MIRNETRESAHVNSRVKDLSNVPNIESYNGLFAAITPIATFEKNTAGLYNPILVRDVDSLIALFGDPKIDPEKYIDLYNIMQVIGNGGTCYVAKVNSGEAGVFSNLNFCASIKDITFTTSDKIVWTSEETYEHHFDVVSISLKDVTDPENPVITALEYNGTPTTASQYKFSFDAEDHLVITLGAAPASDASNLSLIQSSCVVNDDSILLTGRTSSTDALSLESSVSQAKPFSLNAYYLNVKVKLSATVLATAKVALTNTLTNQGLINALNSYLGVYVQFTLNAPEWKDACIGSGEDLRPHSIVYNLLNFVAPGNAELNSAVYLVNPGPSSATFNVSLKDYQNAINQYRDKRFVGCLMADMTAPLTHRATTSSYNSSNTDEAEIAAGHLKITFGVPDYDERRSLHYYLKQVASERKDVNVVLAAPYFKYVQATSGESDPAKLTKYDGKEYLSFDKVCEWVSSTGEYSDLWEYGESNTTDYTLQSFYLEMYYGWLNMKCTKVENGIARAVVVPTAPTCVIINNILTSYRERGMQYPVAGDQGGVLPESCAVIANPETKMVRDQLVQYRINPIWDTGTRGVQIFGNETLNAGYTDLNAAHIARELVDIRHRIDEYTETLKFSINSIILWDTWKNYVTSNILEPRRSVNAISEFAVAMGEDTTTPEEIANRRINGRVDLIFYQSAEIFNLDFVIYSSSTTLEAE